MQNIIFLKPIFHERIWGGRKLNEVFKYTIPCENTGECWAISAHKNGDCEVLNGELKGQKLSEVYQNHRELFANSKSEVFPLLTKILDANQDLSVQVHPDDLYALKNELELGKTECWYIIDCKEDTQMIFGHYARSQAELQSMIENNEWDGLLRKVKIKPGDFFFVPSGTIHAICKDTLVLETQQSSDTTYRVYDYNRIDPNGNLRPLHVKQALEVTTVPHKDYHYNKEITKINESYITTFVKTDYFSVEKWTVAGSIQRKNTTFLLVSVLKGKGSFCDEQVQMGDHFIVTSQNKEIHCQGNMELIVSYI